MQQIFYVFIGGGIGSVLRYLIGLKLNNTTLPYGTLLANIVGSLLIGFVMSYHLKTTNQALTNHQLAFIVIGLFGGFTTFSSFMYENMQFLIQEQYLRFLGYVSFSLLIGFLAVFIGFILGKQI